MKRALIDGMIFSGKPNVQSKQEWQTLHVSRREQAVLTQSQRQR